MLDKVSLGIIAIILVRIIINHFVISVQIASLCVSWNLIAWWITWVERSISASILFLRAILKFCDLVFFVLNFRNLHLCVICLSIRLLTNVYTTDWLGCYMPEFSMGLYSFGHLCFDTLQVLSCRVQQRIEFAWLLVFRLHLFAFWRYEISHHSSRFCYMIGRFFNFKILLLTCRLSDLYRITHCLIRQPFKRLALLQIFLRVTAALTILKAVFVFWMSNALCRAIVAVGLKFVPVRLFFLSGSFGGLLGAVKLVALWISLHFFVFSILRRIFLFVCSGAR